MFLPQDQESAATFSKRTAALSVKLMDQQFNAIAPPDFVLATNIGPPPTFLLAGKRR